MFQFLKSFTEKQTQRKFLLGIYRELEENLENYYVFYQLNRLRPFNLQQAGRISAVTAPALPAAVRRYVDVLIDYNRTLQDFKDYETWYAADISRKTKENGIVLHEKNARAREKFQQGIEEIIKTAKTQLEIQLKEMRILK